MKRRKKITRRELLKILEEAAEASEDGEIEVQTDKRIYRVKVEKGRAILPSGKAFEVDGRHVC